MAGEKEQTDEQVGCLYPGDRAICGPRYWPGIHSIDFTAIEQSAEAASPPPCYLTAPPSRESLTRYSAEVKHPPNRGGRAGSNSYLGE